MITLRHRAIVRSVRQTGFQSFDALAREFRVSIMTIRRDAVALAELGAVVKRRGGLQSVPEAMGSRSMLAVRSGPSRVLDEAAALCKPGMTVGITAGPSAARLAARFSAIPRLTVVTNSIRAANELWSFGPPADARTDVVMLPGDADESEATTGPLAIAAINQFALNLSFLCVAGFDVRRHRFTDSSASVEVVGAFGACSQQTVVLVECEDDWKSSGPRLVGALQPMPIVIVGSEFADSRTQLLREAGYEVRRAKA
jgi:DeoR/GlpR family transcriptional regulator of sugar metabolism